MMISGPPATRRISRGRVLRVAAGTFWYDTARNDLWAVDEVLADTVRLFTTDNDKQVHADLDVRHGRSAVEQALAEIRAARAEEGVFTTTEPEAAPRDCSGWPAALATGLRHLTLCLGERCNLRCGYCPLDHESGPAMSADTAVHAVRLLMEHSAESAFRNVSFYGGEPLLHVELIRTVVAEVARHPEWPPLRLTIDTNATLIDDEMAEFLAAGKFNLQISCDGPPARHDRYRRHRDGGPTHTRVMDGLRRLLRLDPGAADRLSFIATVGPPYDYVGVAEYFADLPLLRELGLPSCTNARLNTVDPGEMDLGVTSALRSAQHREGLDRAAAVYETALLAGRRSELPPALAGMFERDLVRWHHRDRGQEPASIFPGGACVPGLRRLFVGPDGDIHPCERTDGTLIIGNVATGFDLPAMAKLDRELLAAVAENCPGCWARRLCGVCQSSLGHGPAGVADSCHAVRRQAADTLRRYLRLKTGNPDCLDFLAESRLI